MSKTNWNKIVSGKELIDARANRSKTFITQKNYRSALVDLIKDGWVESKTYADSRFVGVRKDKPFDEQFEDKVWLLFSKMGFTFMNVDRNFAMSYDYQNPDHTQQIDVFAADEESIIIVECKSAESLKQGVFKKEIEALHGQMDGLIKEAKKQYPGRKIRFVWATHNYIMSHADIDRLRDWNIAYFSDSIIDYYSELVKHLGLSAKYQLLGNLFANTEIKNMEDRIPAIQGKMGGYTYYSFSIEPERLLKIGYVLHRNEANRNMMPTYQRLIKKKRLQAVQQFINEGGYFPNSIIISIDSNGKGLQFDYSQTKVDSCISRLGVLHLPKRYRSAFIIDGQHRLYGYSNSDYAKTNSIPVVAFVDLEREEQIKLFMDINENQKAVTKTLRVTLNADMLWSSDNQEERRQAIRSKIAQMLGEEPTSPLLNRVVIGEEEKSPTKSITVEAIQGALKRCNFLSVFGKKNTIKEVGSFDLGENQASCDRIYVFLEKSLIYIKTHAETEWARLDKDSGMISMNRGIQAIIRILNDLINMLVERKEIQSKTDSIDLICQKIQFYLDPLIDYLNAMTNETRKDLRGFFGGGADTRFWRAYQKAISDARSDFNPVGLNDYWQNEAKMYNQESIEYIKDIKGKLKDVFAKKLEETYHQNWIVLALPKSIYNSAKQKADEENYELIRAGQSGSEVSLWDYITFADLKIIATSGSHWTEIFEQILTRPEETKISGGKDAKTEWLTRIENIFNKLQTPNYSVSIEEFEFIKAIRTWIGSEE